MAGVYFKKTSDGDIEYSYHDALQVGLGLT